MNLNDLNNDIYDMFIGDESPEGSWAQPGWFGKHATIMFIGQNPGMPKVYEPFKHRKNQEIYLHYVKNSPTGSFISNIIKLLNLDWDDIAYTNIVKVPTKNNNIPSKALVQDYLPILRNQISLVQPKLIVAFGRFAGECLGMTTFYRVNDNYDGIPSTMIPHPSYISRLSNNDMKHERKLIMLTINTIQSCTQ